MKSDWATTDESHRLNTTIVLDDHRFCAERIMDVGVMPTVHRHSQFEINYLLKGSMTYWFDGREVTVETGKIAIFWGMVPHQLIRHTPHASFICLYIPASIFVSLPVGDVLRTALFGGDLVEPMVAYETDNGMFRRWREDLLSKNAQLEAIVRDELSARLRRVDRDGWRDLRGAAPTALGGAHRSSPQAHRLEAMARFIGEHSHEDISVADVAAHGGFHPNYAMTLFRNATGLTISQAIARNRLDTAQSLLVSTSDDIADIAFAVGFGSLSRFYEAFKARFDMSPARFRRWHRAP